SLPHLRNPPPASPLFATHARPPGGGYQSSPTVFVVTSFLHLLTSLFVALSAFTAAPSTPISSDVGITSNRLPCSGLIFTISWTSRSSSPVSRYFVSGPVMKNIPGPSMWILVAVAAASARWHNCTNSAHRASPARALSNTSSGSKSRKRMRIEQRPRIPSRCPLPPHPQKLSFGSSVTTECPPSHTPSLAGYRPHAI